MVRPQSRNLYTLTRIFEAQQEYNSGVIMVICNGNRWALRFCIDHGRCSTSVAGVRQAPRNLVWRNVGAGQSYRIHVDDLRREFVSQVISC